MDDHIAGVPFAFETFIDEIRVSSPTPNDARLSGTFHTLNNAAHHLTNLAREHHAFQRHLMQAMWIRFLGFHFTYKEFDAPRMPDRKGVYEFLMANKDKRRPKVPQDTSASRSEIFTDDDSGKYLTPELDHLYDELLEECSPVLRARILGQDLANHGDGEADASMSTTNSFVLGGDATGGLMDDAFFEEVATEMSDMDDFIPAKLPQIREEANHGRAPPQAIAFKHSRKQKIGRTSRHRKGKSLNISINLARTKSKVRIKKSQARHQLAARERAAALLRAFLRDIGPSSNSEGEDSTPKGSIDPSASMSSSETPGTSTTGSSPANLYEDGCLPTSAYKRRRQSEPEYLPKRTARFLQQEPSHGMSLPPEYDTERSVSSDMPSVAGLRARRIFASSKDASLMRKNPFVFRVTPPKGIDSE